MAFIPPDITTVFEDWDRADGAAHAGAGAAIWDDTGLDGSASTLVVSSSQGAVSSGGSALTVESVADQCRVIEIDTAGSSLWAYFFRWQDSTHWYRLLFQGANWRLSVNNGAGASDLSTATGQAYASGDKFEIVVDGDLCEVYQYTGGAWNETPVLSSAALTDITAAGPSVLFLDATDWRIGDILDVDTSGPGEPVTIYVNPEHEDASDSYTRAQASSRDTPLRSLDRAMALAFSRPEWLEIGDGTGDHINLAKVVSVANALDPFDSRCYAAGNHVRDDNGTGTSAFPFGDNEGNAPIVIESDYDLWDPDPEDPDYLVPICRGINGRFLRGWTIKNVQQGYDTGLEVGGVRADVLTRTSWASAADMECENVRFTGGGTEVAAWHGTLKWKKCFTTAPLSDLKLSLDGRGFGLGYLPDQQGQPEEAGLAWFDECIFDGIRGNDAIQGGIGAFDDPNAELRVTNSAFWNCVEGDPVYHTDSIQLQGGAKLTVLNNSFIGCSDAVMVTDYHSGTIRIEGNVIKGAGSQIQCHGFEHLIIRHNSMFPASTFGANASIMIFNRADSGSAATKKVTIVNNIYGGIFYNSISPDDFDAGSVIDNNASLSAPGADTGYGTNLPGIPEYGTSARMAGLPTSSIDFPSLPANYELANTITNPAIGAGLDLSDTDEGPVLTDRLGRAYPQSAPDVGCHQSDPGTNVSPVARAPYLISTTPTSGATGVARAVSVVHTLYPKPGETLDTVTAGITDPAALTIPTATTVSDPDENGYQTVTVDPKYALSPEREGQLDPLVVYMWMLTAVDTEGSGMTPATGTFRTIGRGVPAITAVSDGGLVGLRQPRTAQFLTAGGTGAAFEKPSPSAAFEQADALVLR